MSYRVLELVLAQAGLMGNDLRRRLIIKRQRTFIAVQQSLDLLRILLNLQIGFFPDTQCQLTVFQHFYHSGSDLIANPELGISEQFFFRDQSGKAVIHCHKRTEILADLIDPAGYLIVFFVRAVRAQMFIDIHGRTQSAALVDIEGCQHLFSGLYLAGLLLKGQEQILLQSPVQESTYFPYLYYSEQSHLSHTQLRGSRRRDQTVTGIPVQEYFQFISDLCSFRHLLRRQQHFVLRCFLRCQIHSEFYFFHYYQRLFFA